MLRYNISTEATAARLHTTAHCTVLAEVGQGSAAQCLRPPRTRSAAACQSVAGMLLPRVGRSSRLSPPAAQLLASQTMRLMGWGAAEQEPEPITCRCCRLLLCRSMAPHAAILSSACCILICVPLHNCRLGIGGSGMGQDAAMPAPRPMAGHPRCLPVCSRPRSLHPLLLPACRQPWGATTDTHIFQSLPSPSWQVALMAVTTCCAVASPGPAAINTQSLCSPAPLAGHADGCITPCCAAASRYSSLTISNSRRSPPHPCRLR